MSQTNKIAEKLKSPRVGLASTLQVPNHIVVLSWFYDVKILTDQTLAPVTLPKIQVW